MRKKKYFKNNFVKVRIEINSEEKIMFNTNTKKEVLPNETVKMNFTLKENLRKEFDNWCKIKRVPKSWKLSDLIRQEIRRNPINT